MKRKNDSINRSENKHIKSKVPKEMTSAKKRVIKICRQVGTTNTKKEEIETQPERTERTSVLFEGKK